MPEIVFTDSVDEAARGTLLRLLVASNEERMGRETDLRPLGLLLKDPATGSDVGGLWGRTALGWLFVELLYLPPSMRGMGVGTRLMRLAEEEAARRGCHGVWLDTFSFQAPSFYKRLGYEVFGTIADYPPGHSRQFLSKVLKSSDQRATTDNR